MITTAKMGIEIKIHFNKNLKRCLSYKKKKIVSIAFF